ncbi:MAG: hypothetical protein JXR71_10670 [Bacteroidales bacterium]|nr:hypothetical protein [Bacteroidales bacterium]
MSSKATFLIGSILILIFLSACQTRQNGAVLFNASILNHADSPETVIKKMGEKPDTSFFRLIIGKPRYIQMYDQLDSAEFRFAHNKLIEVIVHKPDFPFADSTISKFGLPYKKHTQMDSSAYIMWKNVYKNLEVVNFYLVGSKQDNRSERYKIYFKLKQ